MLPSGALLLCTLSVLVFASTRIPVAEEIVSTKISMTMFDDTGDAVPRSFIAPGLMNYPVVIKYIPTPRPLKGFLKADAGCGYSKVLKSYDYIIRESCAIQETFIKSLESSNHCHLLLELQKIDLRIRNVIFMLVKEHGAKTAQELAWYSLPHTVLILQDMASTGELIHHSVIQADGASYAQGSPDYFDYFNMQATGGTLFRFPSYEMLYWLIVQTNKCCQLFTLNLLRDGAVDQIEDVTISETATSLQLLTEDAVEGNRPGLNNLSGSLLDYLLKCCVTSGCFPNVLRCVCKATSRDNLLAKMLLDPEGNFDLLLYRFNPRWSTESNQRMAGFYSYDRLTMTSSSISIEYLIAVIVLGRVLQNRSRSSYLSPYLCISPRGRYGILSKMLSRFANPETFFDTLATPLFASLDTADAIAVYPYIEHYLLQQKFSARPSATEPLGISFTRALIRSIESHAQGSTKGSPS